MEVFGSWVSSFIANYGYIGIFLALVINCMGVPVASELILPLIGIALREGSFDPAGVYVIAVSAQVLGLSIAYVLARENGLSLLRQYGKYLFISQKNLTSAQRYFKKRGASIVIAGLLMPGVHGDMGYVAGLEKMKYYQFLIIAILGTMIWTAALMSLGYFVGGELPLIEKAFSGIGALVIMAAIWYSRRYWARKHRTIRRTRKINLSKN